MSAVCAAHSMQPSPSYFGFLFASFEVDLTALLTEQIGQNGPKTRNYFSPK